MYASLIPVADLGRGPVPPPYFWTKLRPEGPQKIFLGGGESPPPLSKGLDDLPPLHCICRGLNPALLTPVLHV